MSSAPPSRVLVSHKFEDNRHVPSLGEVIVVHLSQDLYGPGGSRDAPSRADHNVVVLNVVMQELERILTFTVLPMPAYSATSGLSSTSWLLSQAVDFQQQHILVPYEQSPQPQPPFSTPDGFGDPLEMGGWKNSRPSWVLAVPQVTNITYQTIFKCFEPPVRLSKDELRRLRAYSGLSPGPGERNNRAGAGLPAGSSLAFQALYANDAVKQAFASAVQPPPTVLDSDSDSDDEDDDWEDRMDPVTFARCYAGSNPHLAKIVQEHDQKMRARLCQEITNWAEGVQSETFEDDG